MLFECDMVWPFYWIRSQRAKALPFVSAMFSIYDELGDGLKVKPPPPIQLHLLYQVETYIWLYTRAPVVTKAKFSTWNFMGWRKNLGYRENLFFLILAWLQFLHYQYKNAVKCFKLGNCLYWLNLIIEFQILLKAKRTYIIQKDHNKMFYKNITQLIKTLYCQGLFFWL